MKTNEFLSARLSPLKFKNYRAFLGAYNVSLIGSWMQELAKSWIVLNLVGKGSSMGALLFAAAVPSILFGSFVGILADRRGAKTILLWTQALLAVIAFWLGMLVTSGHVEFWHLVVFAVLEGTVIAFDIPAFNQVTPQLVPREDFQQAMALNATSFHMARVIGPSIAGVLMGTLGTASVFWFNAASFLAVLWVIYKLPLREHAVGAPTGGDATKLSMREAIDYIRNHPVFMRIFLQVIITMALVFPLVFTTFRVLLQDRFHLNGHDFGLVFAVPGLGALFGSTAFLLMKPANPLKVLPAGIGGTVIFLFMLAETHTLPLNLIAMLGYSVAMFVTLSALLVTVQVRVEHHFRGRISALIGMAFSVLAPCMSVPVGWIGDRIGNEEVIGLVAVLYAFLSLSLGWKYRNSSHV